MASAEEEQIDSLWKLCAYQRNQEVKQHLPWFPEKKAEYFRKFIDWETELAIVSTSQHMDYNGNEGEVLVLQKNTTVSRKKKGDTAI